MDGIPYTLGSVTLTEVEVDGETYSVWTDERDDREPDFIIVSPPTWVEDADGAETFAGKKYRVDLLAALATIISEASSN